MIDSYAHYSNNAYKKLFWYLIHDMADMPAEREPVEAILEFVSFVNDAEGNPIYENTYQYAILKKEWDAQRGDT